MEDDVMETMEVTNNDFLRQFEAKIQDELIVVEYSKQERKIFLTKLRMSEELREKGYLEKFIKAVLEIIEETNSRVMPTCPEIVSFFRKNRRYKSMLPVGINI